MSLGNQVHVLKPTPFQPWRAALTCSNFALGGYFSFALYVTYLLGQGKAAGGMALVPGIAAMALMLHYLLFQPMHRSGASPDRLLIVGLGIQVIGGKEYTGLRGNFVQIQGAMTGAQRAM